MKQQRFQLLIPLTILLLLNACNYPINSKQDTDARVNTIVASTFQALTHVPQGKTPEPSITNTVVKATVSPQLTSSPSSSPGPTLTSTQTLEPSKTKAATNTPIPEPGTIAGNILGYPYGSLPSLSIVAFGQEPPYNYSYIITNPGSAYYEMTGDYVLPGHYQVVAYDSSNHKGGCSMIVEVTSKKTVICDINNWSGSYPNKPAKVPSP
jgi:hypothetical protein